MRIAPRLLLPIDKRRGIQYANEIYIRLRHRNLGIPKFLEKNRLLAQNFNGAIFSAYAYKNVIRIWSLRNLPTFPLKRKLPKGLLFSDLFELSRSKSHRYFFSGKIKAFLFKNLFMTLSDADAQSSKRSLNRNT